MNEPHAQRRTLLKTVGLSLGAATLAGVGTGTSADAAPERAARSDPQTVDRSPADSPSVGGAWTTYHSDARNTGANPDARGVASTPWIDWSTKVCDDREPDLASPVVADGTAYTFDDGGTVSALDVASGSVEWQTELGSVSDVGPVTVEGDTVFVATGPHVYALGAGDGARKWTFTAPERNDAASGDSCGSAPTDETDQSSAVTVDGDAAYVTMILGGDDRRFAYALDAASGDRTWKTELSGSGTVGTRYRSTPFSLAVGDGSVYAVDHGTLFRLNAADGTTESRVDVFGDDTHNPRLSAPAVDDGTVYLTGHYYETRTDSGDFSGLTAQLLAVDVAGSSVRWRTDLEPKRLARPPTVAHGRVYVPELIWAANAEDGSIEWKVDGLGRSISAGSDAVYCTTLSEDQSEPESVVELDPSDGTERWRVPLRAPQPYASPSSVAVLDGAVFVSGRAGYVYAISGESAARWRADVTAGTRTDATVADGVAYVVDFEGVLRAFDAESGEVKWKHAPTGYEGPMSYRPVVADGTVYYGVGERAESPWTMYAFDAETGDKRWRTRVADGVGRPAVAGGAVYFANEDAAETDSAVTALDAKTGERRWVYRSSPDEERIDDVITGSVVAMDGAVYVPTENCVWILDGETGERRATVGESTSALAAADSTLYVGESAGDGALVARSADGTERWRAPLSDDSNAVDSLVAADGAVYAVGVYDAGQSIGGSEAGSDGELLAYDAADGSKRWRFDLADDLPHFMRTGQSVSAPAVAGGSVYVASDDRRIYALDAADGSETARYETFGCLYGTPAVDDTGVYVGDADGRVYAFERGN
ncbi:MULTISPECIES: PQQ-binding-like beta-propeller repeat protein [Halorussus]|uniref:outer membrane protein assembly factor BamB family protein n=1 Tax=Halorussus TaxID=1070314 RepID=UPI0020A0425B|nr:PQQ-binding-like beta-propeller repeat protein [Halorussus vallis]USZ77509.1 PQQ-binding-like beta-propeller repeat protein [Halorussus vallis]